MNRGGRTGLSSLLEAPGPLGDAVRACRTHFGYAALFSALVNVLYLAPTLYMMQVYDRVIPTSGKLTLLFLTVVLLLSLGTLSALDQMRTRLLARAGLRLERRLAAPILDRLTEGQGPRNARSRQALRELDLLRQVLGGAAVVAVMDAPWTPIYLIIAFLIHPLLGIVTLLGGITLFGLAWMNERATKGRHQRASELQAAAYGVQETLTRQAETVRALGMRRTLVARQVLQREQAITTGVAGNLEGGRYSSLIKFVRLALQSLALGCGAWLAINNKISAGSVIAASVLLSRALQPIEQLVGSWPSIVQARGAVETLSALLGRGGEAPRTRLPDPRGEIGVEKATVMVAPEVAALKEVSLSVAPGETVAVIGPSGAGKSTLARLLAGAVEPDEGVVRIDGASYADWDRELLARHIGYVPQDPGLFEGTIRDNLARFDPDPDRESVDARVIEAAKSAGVHDLILRLKDGYDTRLDLGGAGLSAGQAQRLALARALYGKPVLLILDEPNAHLDAEGEQALTRVMVEARTRGAAVVIVAHRAGALIAVGRMIVMREGRIEIDGPRDEVLARLKGQAPQRAEAGATPRIVRSQP